MRKIPFIKFTAYGNNFVILDETHSQLLSEPDKSSFAFQATNMYYGIGSDSFLVIQQYTPDILQDINDSHHYWEQIPDSPEAEYIFRIFEKNGEESSSCGNGLVCVANYMHHRYGIELARIVTEIPMSTPKVVIIGTNPRKDVSWVNMGHLKRMPPQLVDSSGFTPYDDHIEIINEMTIIFDQLSLPFVREKTSLTFSGYLVFTGEPHLVIFPERDFSLLEFASRVFSSSNEDISHQRETDLAPDFSSWIVDYIGNYINRHYAHIFPFGINVNFVRMPDHSNVLEYRCFERGVNRETLACGTGAIAIAVVTQHLKMLSTQEVTVWPYCSRWYDPQAQIHVKESEQEWFLYGTPMILCEGNFFLT